MIYQGVVIAYCFSFTKTLQELSRKDLMLKLKKNTELWDESKSWTTDAPYRETRSAIQEMKIKKVTCVEMESSALYAFAKAKNKDVICFAHLTNTMAQQKGDFEKGDDFGSLDTLKLVEGVLEIFST